MIPGIIGRKIPGIRRRETKNGAKKRVHSSTQSTATETRGYVLLYSRLLPGTWYLVRRDMGIAERWKPRRFEGGELIGKEKGGRERREEDPVYQY